MIRINIIGSGFLDFDEKTNIAFKRSNVQFNWSKIEVGRSTEFSVPATDANRLLLGFADDPTEWGDAMRQRFDCEIQYSGDVCYARLIVTKFDGDRFSCLLYYPYSDSIDKINDKPLSECATTFSRILFASENIYSADDPSLPDIALVQYDGSYSREAGGTRWAYMPSIRVKAYIENVLTQLGVAHDLDIPTNLRLVTPTLKGATMVQGTISKSVTGTAGSIAANLQQFFEWNNDAELKWWDNFFGFGHTVSCPSLRPKVDVEVMFPNDFPNNVQLLHRNGNTYTPVTDRYVNMPSTDWVGEPLAGRTVTLKAGIDFWFLDGGFLHYDMGNNSYYTGWKTDVVPWSYTFRVSRSENINVDEYWDIRYNAPDMTVIEFLRSVALLLGEELYYDFTLGKLCMKAQDIGSVQRTNLSDVLKIESVARNVGDWGTNTVKEIIKFDSEDYVQHPLTDTYKVLNNVLEDEQENTIKFSEGEPSEVTDGAVYIDDTEFSSTPPKVTAKKWTAGLSGTGKVLRRVSFGGYGANGTIANKSCCVVIKAVMDLYDYLHIDKTAVFFWQGVQYVWTSASWADGIVTLTLQAY